MTPDPARARPTPREALALLAFELGRCVSERARTAHVDVEARAARDGELLLVLDEALSRGGSS